MKSVRQTLSYWTKGKYYNRLKRNFPVIFPHVED
ncbi:rCG22327 [Rattus norvegicus]|uniref:RCG22327 n=1 Tax=Rattus norvegicus TaxID=10116 RepID=A6IPE2_RAT|nr:rCG22327 [Rattus norvegicus]